jgi:hypothetical protein
LNHNKFGERGIVNAPLSAEHLGNFDYGHFKYHARTLSLFDSDPADALILLQKTMILHHLDKPDSTLSDLPYKLLEALDNSK